jgi:hypothetical protein
MIGDDQTNRADALLHQGVWLDFSDGWLVTGRVSGFGLVRDVK